MSDAVLSPTLWWAILGLVLITAEIFTATFMLLFFGLGALLVALLKLFGLSNLPLEIIVFSVLGLSGLLLFRRKLLDALHVQNRLSNDVNEKVLLETDVAPNEEGQAQYQGTTWVVVNQSSTHLKQGQHARVVRTSGVKLFVEPM